MGGDWIEVMKTNFQNWDFSSKKLPNEQELEEFFNCISADSAPRNTGFFASVPKFNYQNTGDRWNNSKYPIFRAEDDSWIIPSLKELDPSITPSSTVNNLVQSEQYDEGHDVGLRNVPALGLSLPPDVVRRIETASTDCCLNSQTAIKSFRDLSSIKYKIEEFVKDFIARETTVFKHGLAEGNYIQANSHLDILEKIKKIRKAIPTDPVFVVAETPLLDYLKIHSVLPGELERNVWLVQDNYSSYSYRDTHPFNGYKSAVFSTNQMSGSHEFEFHYKMERGNRQWKIYIGVIGRLAMDIPPDPLQHEGGQLKPNDNHPRWDRLF